MDIQESIDHLAVDSFSREMKDRLDEKRLKDGKRDWWNEDKVDLASLNSGLKAAHAAGRMVDVANYAMMINHHQKNGWGFNPHG